MTNLAEPRVIPHASTRRSRRVSAIWIIPLVAVAIGAWLAWDTLSKEGPTIKISFESAEGLRAGRSIHTETASRLPPSTITNCIGDRPLLHLQRICSKISPHG